ncbi:(E2-independent) E3 ubiquitin-conjugating enzyme FATS [Aulostomus maculatus]
MRQENPAIMAPNEFRQAHSTADGLALKDQGNRMGQLAKCRLRYTEEQNMIDGSLTQMTPQHSYRSSIHREEALELFRPDFISRSQSRVRRLEQRAMRRRALQDSNPDLVQGLREDRGKQKKNCTTPHPLSDNLFKPRERSISGREMQWRSRRIYNKLPEVTKKKEEEKKRAVSQTNRLRAEVFKKRLLDQILQR